VVIELKKGIGHDAVVGQILRYMAWVRKRMATHGEEVHGIIVASSEDEGLKRAISEVSDKVSIRFYKARTVSISLRVSDQRGGKRGRSWRMIRKGTQDNEEQPNP
jgi:RecB family endonuclease NucS